jgi:hypothetical protein
MDGGAFEISHIQCMWDRTVPQHISLSSSIYLLSFTYNTITKSHQVRIPHAHPILARTARCINNAGNVAWHGMTDRADPDGDNLGKMGFLRVCCVLCVQYISVLASLSFSWDGPSDGSLPASGRNYDIT